MLEIARAVHTHEVVVGHPVELGQLRLHVDAGSDRACDQEAVGCEAERVRAIAVPALGSCLPRVKAVVAPGHVVEHVAQARVTEVDELSSNALAIHVRKAQYRVVQTVPVVALRLLVLGVYNRTTDLYADAIDGAGVDLVAVPMELVEEAVELLGQVLRPQFLGNPCMRITRDDDHLVVHESPLQFEDWCPPAPQVSQLAPTHANGPLAGGVGVPLHEGLAARPAGSFRPYGKDTEVVPRDEGPTTGDGSDGHEANYDAPGARSRSSRGGRGGS